MATALSHTVHMYRIWTCAIFRLSAIAESCKWSQCATCGCSSSGEQYTHVHCTQTCAGFAGKKSYLSFTDLYFNCDWTNTSASNIQKIIWSEGFEAIKNWLAIIWLSNSQVWWLDFLTTTMTDLKKIQTVRVLLLLEFVVIGFLKSLYKFDSYPDQEMHQVRNL